MASTIASFIFLIFCCFGMGTILFYVFALRKVPLYQMKKRAFFRMIYDDFHLENRYSLLFFLFFFIKRIIYAIDLAFFSDRVLTPLNVYIFLVCIIPMLYFSYALPFKYVGLNALLCLDEFSEFLVGVVLLHYKNAWLNDEEFFGYARFLIIYITFWIMMHLFFMTIHILYNAVVVCKDSWTF